MSYLKKSILFFTCLFLLCINDSNAQLKTPPASSFQSIKQSFGLSEITLEYSRPNVKGRKIFGELVPYNKMWRTGANASTKITFGDDVIINGKNLPAGTYAILTIPGEQQWDILFNKDTKLGANVALYEIEKEAMRIKVPVINSSLFFETFTIQFLDVKPASAIFTIAWENTMVQFNIETKIDDKIMANIEEAMKSEKPPYFQASSYYYENNKDLKKAYEWAKNAANQMPEAYWVQALKARIELKLNNKQAAATTAKKVIELAGKANNQDYVKIGNDLLEQAK